MTDLIDTFLFYIDVLTRAHQKKNRKLNVKIFNGFMFYFYYLCVLSFVQK